MLSEAKRDRARHAQRAERSGGLQGGGNRGVLKQFQQYRRTKNRKTVVPEIQ